MGQCVYTILRYKKFNFFVCLLSSFTFVVTSVLLPGRPGGTAKGKSTWRKPLPVSLEGQESRGDTSTLLIGMSQHLTGRGRGRAQRPEAMSHESPDTTQSVLFVLLKVRTDHRELADQFRKQLGFREGKWVVKGCTVSRGRAGSTIKVFVLPVHLTSVLLKNKLKSSRLETKSLCVCRGLLI